MGAHLEGDRLVYGTLDEVNGEHLVLARAAVVHAHIHVLGRRAVGRLARAHVAARDLLRDVGDLEAEGVRRLGDGAQQTPLIRAHLDGACGRH